MSGASQAETMPDFLRTAQEYRDRLKAELSRVDTFLSVAAERRESGSGPGETEYPEFLLLGDDEVLETLLPDQPGSRSVH